MKYFNILIYCAVFLLVLSQAIATNSEVLHVMGANNVGQLGNGVSATFPRQSGNGTDDWAYISAGDQHGLAIKTDGTLWGWGYNAYSQLGDGTTTNRAEPILVSDDTDWQMVSAGHYHSMGIKTDGTLWAWGNNSNGRFGDGTQTSRSTPYQIGNQDNWAYVVCGSNHCLALKTNGTLWAWGANWYGELGDGTTTTRYAAVQIGTDNDWEVISTFDRHSMAVKSDGTLWAWGWNGYSQLGDGTNTNRPNPTQIGTDTEWEYVSAGAWHSQAIKTDGTLWGWGWNGSGNIGDGTAVSKTTPVQAGSATNWETVRAGSYHSLGYQEDGTIWAWGSNGYNQLGDGTSTTRYSPVQIGDDENWTQISIGYYFSLALKSDGTFWGWGYNNSYQVGSLLNKFNPTVLGTVHEWQSVSAGEEFTLAIKTDGTLWAWGKNNHGQLGDGTTTARNIPIQIGDDNDWKIVSAGDWSSFAIKEDGTLWGWGYNGYGVLGLGHSNVVNTPTKIGVDNNWCSVSAGPYHTMALKCDGTLWATGWNGYGTLGDGTTNSRNTFGQVSLDTDWEKISAGYYHNLAIKTDGTLWAWGMNSSYQLGDGTNSTKHSPVQITTDDNWTSCSAGKGYSSFAIKEDGTLWAWGSNSYANLGDGTYQVRTTPTRIGSNQDWLEVSAGYHHTLAKNSNMELFAWGRNDFGQVGDGSYSHRTVPWQISTNNHWVSITTGTNHSVAILSLLPKIPELSSPATESINIALNTTVYWNSASGADTYNVQISTSREFDENLINITGLDELEYVLTNLDEITEYFWRVRGENSYGAGKWSEIWQFTTLPPIPLVPELVSPANNVINQNLTMDLVWEAVDYAEIYQVQVSTASNFSTLLLNEELDDTEIEISDLDKAVKYYWRVRAKNPGGTGNWSSVRNFTTFPPIPNAPMLVAPANNANQQLLSLELDWNPVQYAEKYHLQLSSSSNFANTIVNNDNIAGISHEVVGLDYLSTYYWRVAAVNFSGTSEWSDIYSFATIPPPPQPPTLSSPVNEAEDIPTATTLNWNASEYSQTYSIQVSDDEDFSNIILNYNSIYGTSYSLSGLNTETTYYWRAKATNQAGSSDWSNTWSFTTGTFVEQSIALVAGWNFISGNILPSDNDIENVFDDIVDDIVIVKEGNNIYIPGSINNINTWNHKRAYRVFASASTTLNLLGSPIVPQDEVLNIPAGWSAIPYLRTSSMLAKDVFDSIEEKVVIVKGPSGEVYIPGLLESMIMYPNKGYSIFLTQSTNFSYPEND